MKIAILVVTYNRLGLLKENIASIQAQTQKDFDLFICDNASNDGTESYVRAEAVKDHRIRYYNTGTNLGGAGGFAYGLRKILPLPYDACWIMDDDSVPESDALEALVQAAELAGADKWSILASAVYWTDGSKCFMNWPPLLTKTDAESVKMQAVNAVPIRNCSFVGVFINTRYAVQAGLPIKEFFIYGDDTEYTLRLHEYCEYGYMCMNSRITHKMKYNGQIGIVEAPEDRLPRYVYDYRNRIFIYRNREHHSWFWIMYRYAKECVKILLRSRGKKLKRVGIVIKGFFQGISFHPQIEKVEKASQ